MSRNSKALGRGNSSNKSIRLNVDANPTEFIMEKLFKKFIHSEGKFPMTFRNDNTNNGNNNLSQVII